MAERYDPRSMLDVLGGRIPPGATIDDAGQLIWKDTGEPIKSNPYKLEKALQIMGLALAPSSSVAGMALKAPEAVSATDSAVPAALQIASKGQAVNPVRSAVSMAEPMNPDVAAAIVSLQGANTYANNTQPATAAPAPTPSPNNVSDFSKLDYMPPAQANVPLPTPRPSDLGTPSRAIPTPTPRPANLGQAPAQNNSNFFSNLFNGPDYQSVNGQVVQGNKLNWGDNMSPADFFRASKALQQDPSLTGMARGGGIDGDVAQALAVIRRVMANKGG